MKTAKKIIAVLALELVLVDSIHAFSFGVGKNYREIAGIEYRQAGAHSIAEVGEVGEELTSGINNYLNWTLPTYGGSNIFYIQTTFSEEAAASRDLSANLAVKVPDSAGGSATNNRSRFQQLSAAYQVFGVQDLRALVRELNKTENEPILKELQRFKKPTVITAVVKAVRYSTSITNRNDFKIEVSADQLKKLANTEASLGFASSSEKQAAYNFSEGTTVAYEISRIWWTWDATSNRIVIGHLRPDRPGIDVGNPPLNNSLDGNMSLDPLKVLKRHSTGSVKKGDK